MNARWVAVSVGVVLAVPAFSSNLFAATTYTFYGNGDSSLGGAVGGTAVNPSSLRLSGDNTTVTGTFTRGASDGTSFNQILVLFIDSVGGGYADTHGFTDNSIDLTRAISGLGSDGSRSVATFASGFTADYALALTVNGNYSVAGLYRLQGGSALQRIKDIAISPTSPMTSRTFTFGFDFADIGLSPGANNHYHIESSYLRNSGARSLESFDALTAASDFGTGTAYKPVTFTSFSTYGIESTPEMTNTALALFGGAALAGGIVMRIRKRFRRASPGA